MALQTPVPVVNRALFIVTLLACMHIACASSVVKLQGTYSSLTYHVEGGDLTGYEIRFIPTNQGTKAVVQVAEGDAGRIYIVNVMEEAGAVQFEIPLASGVSIKFVGKVSADGLRGVITNPSGEHEDLFLKRTVSYWEK